MEIIDKSTDTKTKYKVLRVEIDLDWTARDFNAFFESFSNLYCFYSQYKKMLRLLKDQKSSKVKYAVESHSPLSLFISTNYLINCFKESNLYSSRRSSSNKKTSFTSGNLLVKKISFASPGFTDFLGVAGIIQQIKEILIHYLPNNKTKEEIKILEQERISLQIKNLKDMGFDSIEIKEIILSEEITINRFSKLVGEGKIKKIRIINF